MPLPGLEVPIRAATTWNSDKTEETAKSIDRLQELEKRMMERKRMESGLEEVKTLGQLSYLDTCGAGRPGHLGAVRLSMAWHPLD